MVADIEELETMNASEIYSKMFNAKEVIFPVKENKDSDRRVSVNAGANDT